jgi:hypothetical protein
MRAWVAALLLLAACGSAPGQSTLPLPSPPTAALAQWKDFPAHAKPRPIIAFGVTVDHIQEKGFPTNDRKLAWICNRFVFAPGASLSTSAPAAAKAQGVSYSAISSGRAFGLLMDSRKNAQGGCEQLQPFAITAVRLGTAGFPTERGAMQMSAWLFDVPEVGAYIGYAAIDPSAFWGGRVSTAGAGARVSADGRTLTFTVGNNKPGPCGNDYTAASAESDTAVAVAIKMIPHAKSGQPVACDLVMRVSTITVTLRSPLGDRVLVDEKGNAGEAA